MKIRIKYLIPVVLTAIMLVVYYIGRERVEDEGVVDYEIKFLERVEKEDKLLDINNSSVKDLMNGGLSIKVAREVEAYIEFTGKIEKLEELIRIKGIGEKTVEKLEEKFFIDSSDKKEKIKLAINNASEKELLWYGFNEKEVKRILDFIKKNGKIYSNIELIGIIGEERYGLLGRYISYNTVKKN